MRMTEEEYKDLMARRQQSPLIQALDVIDKLKLSGVKTGTVKGPNKTELSYRYALEMEFPGCDPAFEAITFKLKNGHRYTPDWVFRISENQVMCVEVKARGKNGFRQPSYQRARVMFDQCRVEWPNYTWRWAEKHCGEWTITDY